MKDIITYCGYKCNLYLAYRNKDKDDLQKFSDGIFKYYGIRLSLEECYCNGCMTDDIESPKLIDIECKVRPCVMKKGLENCAYCDQYPCKELETKMIDGEKVAKKFEKPIPDEDYKLFIMPYESRKVLDKIRQKRGLK